MASVTVRNLDAQVVRTLKAQARRNRRSMEAEVRAILEEASMDRADLLDWMDAETARQARPTTPEEVEGWVRATRSRPA